MKLFIFTVRDSAADAYNRPFYDASVGNAIRSFTDEVNRVDAGNMLNKHPSDFVLYQLGYFDDGSAEFTLEPKPVQLVRGADCVNQSESGGNKSAARRAVS